MYKSAVNDNTEDCPKVAVDAFPKVVIRVKFGFTFVDWGCQSLVPNIGVDARAEKDLKSLSLANWNLWVYISLSLSLFCSRLRTFTWR